MIDSYSVVNSVKKWLLICRTDVGRFAVCRTRLSWTTCCLSYSFDIACTVALLSSDGVVLVTFYKCDYAANETAVGRFC